MNQVTNQLVAAAKRFAAPAAVVSAFALGAALFVGHGNVHAASAIDDNSVSALTSLDRAMEAVASRVTPSRGERRGHLAEHGEEGGSEGMMQGLPPGLRSSSGRCSRALSTADRAWRR
jgi:serine protease Do